MNSVIDLIQNHRSIRKFKDVPITKEQTEAIIASAQMASSSSNMQVYSIILVTDANKKKELAFLCGNQPFIAESGLFLVFCADLHRLKLASEMHGKTFITNTEGLLFGVVDATIAAQNAAIAAESLGLGVCYIGALRNSTREVSDLLELPQLVFPLYGMCIGVPDQEPSLRPRMPRYGILHENSYRTESSAKAIKEYDTITEKYYLERDGIATYYSQRMAERFSSPVRPHIRPYLESQGFRLD